jgi:putative tricarboxylic transport membrane protein
VSSKTKAARLGQVGFALGVVLMGFLVAFLTTRIPIGPAYSAVGPRIFPWLIAGALVVVGVLMIIESLSAAEPEEQPEVDWRAMGWVAAGLLAQILLMETVGFILASTLLFVAVARAFGGQRLIVEIVVGFLLCVVAYFGFTWGLGLDLPTGIFAELW